MKLILAFISALFLFFQCEKDIDQYPHCIGLVTDTTGTGDNARIYIPNAFTPNGDGKNDGIRPLTSNIASISFTLYDDRFNTVFSTTTIGQGWNAAVYSPTFIKYYYKIQATTNSNHQIGMCGEILQISCYPHGRPASSFYFEDQLTPFGFTGVTSETLSTCP